MEVLTATIDIEDVRSYRGSNSSRSYQAGNTIPYRRIEVLTELSGSELDNQTSIKPTRPIKEFYHTTERMFFLKKKVNIFYELIMMKKMIMMMIMIVIITTIQIE